MLENIAVETGIQAQELGQGSVRGSFELFQSSSWGTLIMNE